MVFGSSLNKVLCLSLPSFEIVEQFTPSFDSVDQFTISSLSLDPLKEVLFCASTSGQIVALPLGSFLPLHHRNLSTVDVSQKIQSIGSSAMSKLDRLRTVTSTSKGLLKETFNLF